jgi:phage terminase large subunit
VIRYNSVEWDWLCIDELTHFSEFRFVYLWSRVRTTKPIKTKFFGATNPGSLGHEWVRQRWIDKTSEAPGYNPDDYDFIPAKVTDNTFLMSANPDYVHSLEMLPDKERRALLLGDWDVFEGQFFDMWDVTRHTVDPFKIPENWRLLLAWDDGTKAPRSVHLLAIDNDNKVWVTWEYYRTGESIIDAARNIKDELTKLGYWDRIWKLVVDPSMRRKNDQTGMSNIDILENMGFGFQVGEVEPGNNDRVNGWKLMKNYLEHKPYEEPLLKFFKICENAIRTIPQLIYYEAKGASGKVKEDLDTRQEDHAADGIRYGLMSVDTLPSRFTTASHYEIVGRSYKPNSSLG